MKRTAAFLAGVCGIAMSASICHADDAKSADVIHWYTSDSESKAVKVFADAFTAAGGTWVDAAVAGHDAAMAAAATRIQAGQPPAAIVYLSLLDADGLIAQDMLLPLDDVAKAEGWAENMPATVFDAISRDGHVYAAPLALGVGNYLWSSPIALAKVGATQPPQSWDEFFVIGDKLKAKGIIPFAQSGKWYWYLDTFGHVLSSQSVAAYRKFLALDATVFDMPEFKKAVDIYSRLRGYSDPGVPGREWNLSTGMVLRGEAAFELMGDWVKGEVLAAGKVPGKDLFCTIGVGNSPVVVSGDVLVFPKNEVASSAEAQKLLARVVARPTVQLAYSKAKGSLPVRTDIAGGDFDVCGKVALDTQKANSSVPSWPVLMHSDAAGSVADVLGNFWVESGSGPDDLIGLLKDSFSSLK